MASKKELSVVVSNGYKPVNGRWCPKSPKLASDKILLLSGESLLKGEDRTKKILFIKVANIVVFSFVLKVVLPNSKICVSEKYLTAYGLYWLNCSGVCDIHYYAKDSGGKNE